MKSFFSTLLAFAFVSTQAWAFPKASQEAVYDTKSAIWFTPSDVSAFVGPGDVLVIGERHATEQNKDDIGIQIEHGNQETLIWMSSRFHEVSLGMEFFEYTKQAAINGFLAGLLGEDDFLKQVGWGANPFEFYREQVLSPNQMGGVTLGLNIPREISGKVGRDGPWSLTEDDKKLLPPIWERGSNAYFERFQEAMGGHTTPDKLENYFLAQSLWDDTMAWRVSEYLRFHSKVMVVIAGEFHVEFGHGLPARLLRHGIKRVKTILQVEVTDFTEDTLNKAVADDPTYGARADYILVYKR